jgi:hypothetical protein
MTHLKPLRTRTHNTPPHTSVRRKFLRAPPISPPHTTSILSLARCNLRPESDATRAESGNMGGGGGEGGDKSMSIDSMCMSASESMLVDVSASHPPSKAMCPTLPPPATTTAITTETADPLLITPTMTPTRPCMLSNSRGLGGMGWGLLLERRYSYSHLQTLDEDKVADDNECDEGIHVYVIYHMKCMCTMQDERKIHSIK